MGLSVSDSGGSTFTPAPAGTFRARCVQVIDLGTQYSEFYKSSKHKVLIGWELPDQINKESEKQEPFLVWARYTASLHENANLRSHLEAWRGRDFTDNELEGFGLGNILDKTCMVNIAHRRDGNKVYADVKSVMALLDGITVPERHHRLIEFDIDRFREPAMQEVFDTFSDNLKTTIRNSAELKANGQKQEPQNSDENLRELHAVLDNSAPPPDDEVPF